MINNTILTFAVSQYLLDSKAREGNWLQRREGGGTHLSFVPCFAEVKGALTLFTGISAALEKAPHLGQKK